MKRSLLITLLLLLPAVCSAQLYAMRDSVPNSYNFWLYVPKSVTTAAEPTPTVEPAPEQPRECPAPLTVEEAIALSRTWRFEDFKKYRDGFATEQVESCPTVEHRGLPIVVFLHGRSLCGTDLYRVRRYGTLDALTMGCKVDAVVIAPQNRGEGWWKPERVMRIVDWVAERYDVDTTRLYVLGMSLGGYGAIDFAAAYPDRTAAAIGLCGGASGNDLDGLAELPLWIMHGTADRDVPVSASRRVRDAVVKADTTNLMRYEELQGVGHSLLARVFYLHETYDWLFKHSTTDSPRSVNRDINISIDRLNNAYKGLKLRSVTLDVRDPMGNRAVSTTSNSSSSKGDTSGGEWHTIKEGDTLGHIAIRYNTTVKRLCALNGINEKSILRLGKKLRVR